MRSCIFESDPCFGFPARHLQKLTIGLETLGRGYDMMLSMTLTKTDFAVHDDFAAWSGLAGAISDEG